MTRPIPRPMPPVDDDRDGLGQFEHLTERLVGDVEDQLGGGAARGVVGRRGRGGRAGTQAGQVDGTAEHGTGCGIAHSFSTFADRMLDE